jgi:hypothetical protein
MALAYVPGYDPNKPYATPVSYGSSGLGTATQPYSAMPPIASPGPGQPPTLPYTPPTGHEFTGTAPVSTPYGNFTPPNPADVAKDPYYQFQTAEGEKALQRSAAKRGTLLSGGLLKSLEAYRQGLASSEASKAFDRAATAYGLNRDTNAQNYGQQHTSYQDSLDAFRANTDAALGFGNLGLNAARANTGAAGLGSVVEPSIGSTIAVSGPSPYPVQDAAWSARMNALNNGAPLPYLPPTLARPTEFRGAGG